MKRQRQRLGRVIFLFALVLSGELSAQTSITMVTEVWPPFRIDGGEDPAHPDASGLTGIDMDVLRQIEKRLGMTIEVKQHPWIRALEMMKNGQIDIITGIAWTAERAVYLEYVPTSYYAVQPVLYAQKGKGSAVRTYADLIGKTIGQSKNSAYFEPYNSDTSLTKVSLGTEGQILQMLALGRVDLAVGTDPNISWDIKRLGFGAVLEPVSYKVPVKTDLFIAFSKKSPSVELVPLFDEALRLLLADGSMASIAEKYRYQEK